ncbi:hypothetical protein Q1695_004065 [Nippostrongylus brasiliensis]|nr:hypothetical protein Q1695_004065 [Nippostrongylus brasiliensis]
MNSFALENYMQMDANVATLLTSLSFCALVVFCGFRYLLRHCCSQRQKIPPPNYTAQYYITNSGHQCSRFYFDERNHIRSMVITASIPQTAEQYPQIVGFVLEPTSIHGSEPTAEVAPPSPPRYEEALKPVSAPPRYEDQSTASSSPNRSVELPNSGGTTARIESSVDEISSTDGDIDDLKSPRPSRIQRRQLKKAIAAAQQCS